MYLGDFKEDGDIYFKFTTRAFATGIPGTLANTPVLSVYIDEADGTEKTTAENYFDLDVDFDSITGLNNVRIDLSGNAFFATGADYTVVITTGEVDSVSVIGEVVATFSIENRSMGQPAGATLAADIAAIKAQTVTIEADTDDLQGNQGAWATAGAGDVAGAEVDVTKIHGSALTEGAAGRLAAAFVKLFDVVTPLLVASDVMRGSDVVPRTAQQIRDAMKLAPTGNSPAVGSVDKHLDDIETDTGEIGTAGAGLTDLGAMSDGMKTEVGDAVADEEYDNDGTAITLRGTIKLLLAVLSGKSSGGGTATIVFRDIADSKNRISATVDANGNRTAVGTRDAS